MIRVPFGREEFREIRDLLDAVGSGASQEGIARPPHGQGNYCLA